jgi:Family of unknown function (DUF6307)
VKRKGMPNNVEYISLYDQRVNLVATTLRARTDLTEQAAVELAGHVLYALDHIPEKVRYRGR